MSRMTDVQIDEKVKELRILEAQQKELEAKIEVCKNYIKAEMQERDVDELVGEDWTVTWKEITSSRFDQSSFKLAFPKLFEDYKVTSSSKRFNLR